MPSSQSLQRDTRIVVLRILKYRSHGLGDPGPDDADMYARVRIDGQPMASSNIEGFDSFGFGNPYEPLTWIKAVPAVPNEREPVESMEVEVRTGGRVAAPAPTTTSTCASAPNLRFPLDKRLYDDFERGDRDTYSVPIDDAYRQRACASATSGSVADREVARRHRRRLEAGRREAARQRPHRLRRTSTSTAGSRTTTAPGRPRTSLRAAPRGSRIPVRLELGEDDALYGGDDHGDINPFGHRRDVLVGYPLGTLIPRRTTRGGNTYGGRLGDGDEAEITYRLETITPELIKAPPPPPPPGPKPDLVITDFILGQHHGQEPGPRARRAVPGDDGRHDLLATRVLRRPRGGRLRDAHDRTGSAATTGRHSWTISTRSTRPTRPTTRGPWRRSSAELAIASCARRSRMLPRKRLNTRMGTRRSDCCFLRKAAVPV